MSMRLRSFATLLAPLLVAACAKKPPTAVVLLISSDLSFPAQANLVEIEVTRDGSTSFFKQYPIPGGELKLPGTLVLQNDDTMDPAESVRVDIRALADATQIVTRSAVFSMSDEKIKLLTMPLAAACKDVLCGQGRTCDLGACVDEAVSSGDLPDFESNDAAFAGVGGAAGGKP